MSKIVMGKGMLILLATAVVGLLSVGLFQQRVALNSTDTVEALVNGSSGSGAGEADCGAGPQCTIFNSENAMVTPAVHVTSPLKITAKPRAQYTDEARTHNVEGTVRLKITLMADGRVGNIIPLNQLADGLTEQAIAAAQQIKFEPRRVNGVPQSSIVTFEYSFTIY